MTASSTSQQAGALVLRSALGVVFLAHSVYLKAVVFGCMRSSNPSIRRRQRLAEGFD